jgi:cyclophilin family peptidyl-prolyl cis-trans isomerase
VRVTSLFLASALLLLPGLAEAKKPVVELTIAIGGKVAGKIKLQLDNVKAPKTTANFIKYVKSGHYNGTIFHRVIDGFMIQGGGFTTKLQKKPTRAPIKNEAYNGLKNKRGTIAMARTPNPHSAAAQFFINVKDNTSLDHTGKSMQGWGYCVFGKVIKGMKVVDRIRKIPTGPKAQAGANVPAKPVVIKKAAVL